MNIYVASSWRNNRQPGVVKALREAKHTVYDFKNPPGRTGFGWRQVTDEPPASWSPETYRQVLRHPVAQAGFKSDMDALMTCDACVLVLPCGRSAHLELGWATGAGKRTIVLTDTVIDEPELMYLMCDRVAITMNEVLDFLMLPI